MERTAKERLIEFIKTKGIGQTKFEKICGLSNGYINSLRKAPSYEKVQIIIGSFPDLNPEWLLTGEGEMLRSNAPKQENNMDEETFPDDFTPLVPTSAFAGGAVAVNEPVMLEQCARLPITRQGQPWEMAISVNGDSMEPQIPNGAILLISKVRAKWAVPYGNLAVISTVDGVYIKQIAPGDDKDHLIARSFNPRYPDMVIPADDIIDIYRVHAMFRHF